MAERYRFFITQTGTELCDFTISPAECTFDSVGGKCTIVLNSAPDTCPWKVENDAFWIKLESNDIGSGSGMIKYSVTPNAAGELREAVLEVAGKPFTVKQMGIEDKNKARTGWWYVKSEPGTGVTMSINDDILFLAWFVFEPNGNPIWYAAWAERISSDSFSGTLRRYTGTAPEQEWKAPEYEPVGWINVTFTDVYKANLNWNMEEVDGGSGFKPLVMYMPELVTGFRDSRDLDGWWFDPDYTGMGFFVETRGNTAYIGWYGFNDEGMPRWHTLGGWKDVGGFAAGTESYTGPLQDYVGGWHPGGEYIFPTLMPDGDPAELRINGSGNEATLTFIWNGFTFDLSRYIPDAVPE